MGVWLGPRGSGRFDPDSDYIIVSGSNNFTKKISGNNWSYIFTGDVIIRFKKDPGLIDVFAVGGGEKGSDADYNNSTYWGGNGGAGGELVTVPSQSVIKNQNYVIKIGNGQGATGSAGNTTGFNVTATGGGGVSGGVGAEVASSGLVHGAGNGTSNNTYKAFGGNGIILYYSNALYGTSGGGGGAIYSGIYNGRKGGIGGKITTDTTTTSGNGATYSSQDSSGSWTAGQQGATNRGQGGGGGGIDVRQSGSSVSQKDPGGGGSGILIIRNHVF